MHCTVGMIQVIFWISLLTWVCSSQLMKSSMPVHAPAKTRHLLACLGMPGCGGMNPCAGQTVGGCRLRGQRRFCGRYSRPSPGRSCPIPGRVRISSQSVLLFTVLARIGLFFKGYITLHRRFCVGYPAPPPKTRPEKDRIFPKRTLIQTQPGIMKRYGIIVVRH